MRVFISYADEDKEIAELIAQSIRSRKYKVYFIPPGSNYEREIEIAIKRSRIFVFLISPHSVEQGCYTLTELAMAEKKWERPAGRVLPVLIRPTEAENIPGYLRPPLSTLRPAGNIPAEVAAAVDAMKSPLWARVLSGSAVLFVVGFLLCWFLVGADIRSRFVGLYQVHLGQKGGCQGGKPFSIPSKLAWIEPNAGNLRVSNECGGLSFLNYLGPKDSYFFSEHVVVDFSGDAITITTDDGNRWVKVNTGLLGSLLEGSCYWTGWLGLCHLSYKLADTASTSGATELAPK